MFISSTLGELATERVAVRDAIEALRLTPVMFETGARPHPPRALYRAYLDQSDVFVGIYWERYGWIAPDETISGLEDEYRLAAGRMPQLIYIKESADGREPALSELLARIQDDDRVAYRRFRTTEELAVLVADDLAALLSERFAKDGGERGAPAQAALPVPLDATLGRERDLAAVVELVRGGRRLVTLTGPGGIGKSRLALEVARALMPTFDDHVVFVPLASITEPALVLATIADRAGVRLGGVGDLTDELVAELGRRPTLLLLDNFEQVIDAAHEVAALLDLCPTAAAVVTSRHVLRVHGEREFQVRPLEPSASVALFAERAVAVRPAFAITDENRAAVEEITQRLDGLPLAIELAAACMRLVSAPALVEQLAERMSSLGRGAADAPERQRTLRATMDWSYDLLDDFERRLFARLAVFHGGWTLPAAEAVCTRDGEPEVIETLAALVEKSLVTSMDDTAAEPRLRMLETVRAYAEEKLADLEDRVDTERRHAMWMLELLVGPSRTIRPPHHKSWLEEFDRERANLRIAVQRALRNGDVELVTFLVGTAMGYLSLRDAEAEGGAWLEEAVRLSASAPAAIRARLLRCRAVMAGALGHYTSAENLLGEADHVSPVNPADLMDVALDAMGRAVVASARHSPAEALPAALHAAEAMATAGSDVGEAYMWQTAGTIALSVDPGSADGYLSRGLDVAEAMDNDGLRAQALTLLGYSARRNGRAREARDLFLRAAEAGGRSGQRSSMAYALDGLAAAALDLGDPIVAARALASSECARSSLDRTSWAAFSPLLEEVAAGSRDAAGAEAYEAARQDGARCDIGQALRDALYVVTGADREDARR